MVTASDLGLNPEQFQVFEGVYPNIMLQLVAAGFEAENPGWVLDQRNDAVGKLHQSAVWDNYFVTDCGIAGDANQIYVAPHSPRLRAVTPHTRLVHGGIPLPRDDLPAGVMVYQRNEHILGRDLTEQEARKSQLWLDWAEGNQARLDQYVKNTFRLGKERYKYDTMMGIFVPEDAVERALFVHRFNDRSRADGSNYLYSYYGARLIGVRKKTDNDQFSAQKSDNSSDFLRREASVSEPARDSAPRVSPGPADELEGLLREYDISREELPNALAMYSAARKRNP